MKRPFVTRLGDAHNCLRAMSDASVDSIVTDPPAGIGFMGKSWDSDKGGRDEWIAWLAGVMREALRVLKPGGHALVWAIPRTSGWTQRALEDAGFEIRDVVTHLFGTGFPKSLTSKTGMPEGQGTALKPGAEFWILARKPLAGTVAKNVAEYGTGGLNIDGCRIDGRERTEYGLSTSKRSHGSTYGSPSESADFDASKGRWPANVVLDEEAAAELDAQSGTLGNAHRPNRNTNKVVTGGVFGTVGTKQGQTYADSGGASRFFYVAKAAKKERGKDNTHPTVKSVALMRWLCRLITPPGGTVLDPFMGSGSTGVAALQEGLSFIGIEQEAEYLATAIRRLAEVAPLFTQEPRASP